MKKSKKVASKSRKRFIMRNAILTAAAGTVVAGISVAKIVKAVQARISARTLFDLDTAAPPLSKKHTATLAIETPETAKVRELMRDLEEKYVDLDKANYTAALIEIEHSQSHNHSEEMEDMLNKSLDEKWEALKAALSFVKHEITGNGHNPFNGKGLSFKRMYAEHKKLISHYQKNHVKPDSDILVSYHKEMKSWCGEIYKILENRIKKTDGKV